MTYQAVNIGNVDFQVAGPVAEQMLLLLHRCKLLLSLAPLRPDLCFDMRSDMCSDRRTYAAATPSAAAATWTV